MATAALTSASPLGRWAPRLTTLLVWALAGASVVAWGLRLSVQPSPGAPAPAPAVAAAPDAQAMERALGAGSAPAPTAAAPAAASRYQLLGVLAGQRSGGGAALIAIDGQPARPYRVGASVGDDGWVLQSLTARAVDLGPAGGAAALSLSLPPLRPPAPAGTAP